MTQSTSQTTIVRVMAYGSSTIRELRYNAAQRMMIVVFTTKAAYRYSNVDTAVWHAVVKHRQGVGKGFATLVRADPARYPYIQLTQNVQLETEAHLDTWGWLVQDKPITATERYPSPPLTQHLNLSKLKGDKKGSTNGEED